MNDWDDERPSITGREIQSNIPGKKFPSTRRERMALLSVLWMILGAIALAFVLSRLAGH